MNVALQQVSETHGRTCPDWQALCVPDVNGGYRSFRLFTEGDDLHDAMISAIEEAQSSIRLEVFIFAADEVGWRFANALSAKARAGVDVRFHFDSRGAATGYSPEIFRDVPEASL
jgi:cardiolipin synthase